ncbi:MAG: FAD-dependent oxidoreductase [Rubrivivax sp.]
MTSKEHDERDARTKVAVVGGGIAGLTTCWELLKRGYEVTLFEERMHLGGKMGAHPARIPLWRRHEQWQRDERKRVKEFVDLRSGELQHGRAAELSNMLDGGKVPLFILETVGFYFTRVVKQLGLTSPGLGIWLEKEFVSKLQDAVDGWVERLEPVDDPTAPLKKWRVRYPAVAIQDTQGWQVRRRIQRRDPQAGQWRRDAGVDRCGVSRALLSHVPQLVPQLLASDGGGWAGAQHRVQAA